MAPRAKRRKPAAPERPGRSRLTGADTIVAIATPPGSGALGVIRLSGPDATVIAGRLVVSPRSLELQPPHTVRLVALRDDGEGRILDKALCTVMRAPSSYTGEDVVEFSCHGSPPLLRVLVERLCGAGARLAAPGEFTRRAFLNGRIDLARAEAVALLIGARTERAARLAARALSGELSRRIYALREALVDVIAGLEVSLDFPEDGFGVDAEAARDRVLTLVAETQALLDATRRGRLVHDGVTVALVGRPNAGKSSLLNALLGRERAIVTDTPGTTRDVIEGAVVVDGIAVRLLDTAGLATPRDPIDAEGMKRARAAAAESDLVCLIVDGSQPFAATDAMELRAELQHPSVVLVRSKSDLPPDPAVRALPEQTVPVSVVTEHGLAALLGRLEEEIKRIVGAEREEGAVAASLRQCAGIEAITRALHSSAEALEGQPLEIALVDLREALSDASGLLGLEVGEAVLDRIFATFCVGK